MINAQILIAPIIFILVYRSLLSSKKHGRIINTKKEKKRKEENGNRGIVIQLSNPSFCNSILIFISVVLFDT